jgi:imidazole glycerol phosphate synthase subunit HisF
MSEMKLTEAKERQACAAAMLARGISEWELNLWDTGGGQNESLDGFLDGWLARAKNQPHIPVFAITAATDALQTFLDAVDAEMAESAVKAALLANQRVNTAQQVSTLREFLRATSAQP